MKLPYQQLETHLKKNLAAIYLLSGDEHLLLQEALDLIRLKAKQEGYSERVTLNIDPGADWGKLLYSESHSLSLFATKRLIELHLAGSKPNAANSKILQDMAKQPLLDSVLIITMNKLDSKAEQSAWYKALDKSGITIPIWPITTDQLPHWLAQRAKKANLSLTTEAATLLASQMEGNLLAAAQEIDKLALLQIEGSIDHHTIEKAVTDNARYDVFSMVDCILTGNGKRAQRMLKNLQSEGIEPVLILWALTRELRTLAEMAKKIKDGSSLNSLFSQYRIWEKRQLPVKHFLQKHSLNQCWSMLSQAAQIDRTIKGASLGDTWQELSLLAMTMAGSVIITA
jgi:DNA polymerase III subunit delta